MKRIQKRKRDETEWMWDNKLLAWESWKGFRIKERRKQHEANASSGFCFMLFSSFFNARSTPDSFFTKPVVQQSNQLIVALLQQSLKILMDMLEKLNKK